MIKILLGLAISSGLIALAARHLLAVEIDFSRQLISPGQAQYFLHEFKNFALTNTGADGKINSVIKSPQTEFMPAQQKTLMVSPHITIHSQQQPPALMTAASAQVLHAKNITMLEKNVVVRLGEKNTQNIIMNTQKLLLDNTSRTAKTDLPASVFHRQGEMHGIGLEFDPQTRKITFLNHVRGHYKP